MLHQQTHLLNPSLIELSLRFYIATASWLNQLALAGDGFDEMTCFKEVEIPLPTEVCLLCCVFIKTVITDTGYFWGVILLHLLPPVDVL